MQKEDILAEIRRTAQENGGKPLGKSRFEETTGIATTDWLRYWSRFGDLQREAGFEPNKFNAAYDEGYLFEKIIQLTRELQRFPTNNEKRTKSYNDPDFPSATVFDRLGTKSQLITKVYVYCLDKPQYKDVLTMIEPFLEVEGSEAQSDGVDSAASDADLKVGSVYLFRSGRYYKIGMTKDTVRRGSELRIQLPESLNLIHSIQTDDPSGIEAYWHKRFENKRMNGEWFNLTSADIKAFRRWRKIV
ncbi:MAG TPA: GIY-YIG nuclease family protein [Patescibacteria group bacterium]|nr:GIY-YIG nuclease family protein [Patescibacteria group bacterium]